MGTQLPLPERGTAPNFRPMSVAAEWLHESMPLGMEVGLGPGDFVIWGSRSPPEKGAESPKFSAHVYCGQTAGWINMVLDVEVGLSPGDLVLDGDPAPPKKGGGAALPNVWPISIVAKRLDASRCHLVLRMASAQRTLLDGDPASLPKKGAEPLPQIFGLCLLWPNGWMDQDDTWHRGIGLDLHDSVRSTQLPPEKRAHPCTLTQFLARV